MTRISTAVPPAATLPGWLLDQIGTVPEYAAFAGVDELHERMRRIARDHPGTTSLSRCGTSTQGDPMWCLTVGTGDGDDLPEALVFGLPHPNEPIGGLTAVHLAERLCVDPALRARLGHRWRIVDCADPDGLRLNEGWLAGPFTRAHYAQHFYRPAGADQVEWSFPVNHEQAYFDTTIPETAALVRLLDEHRPRLVGSLHNSERGGAYYYLSRGEPRLNAVLQAVPEHLGIPLHRGEPESPLLGMIDTAIFEAAPFAQTYAATVAREGRWVQRGTSTGEYISRWGGQLVVSELPYWYDDSADDTRPAGISYAAALQANADGLGELAAVLDDTIAAVDGALLAPQSPLWRAVRFYGPLMVDTAADRRTRATAPDDRPATVAEATSLAAGVHETRLRYGGMLRRALRGEVALGNVREPVRAALADVEHRYDTWLAADAEADEPDPIAIGRLVAVQYAAVLAAAAQLAGTLD